VQFRPFWEVLDELGIDLPDPDRIRPHETNSNAAKQRAARNNSWIPPGETIEVWGYNIPGMVYYGESLMSVNSAQSLEPSLIHPSLSVNSKKPDYEGKGISAYFRPYHQLTAAGRAGYLDWLATGRRSKVATSYILLFFYGLERRVFHDLIKVDLRNDEKHRTELKEIITAAKQLKQNYPLSFGYNIDRFIEAAQLLLADWENLEVDPKKASAFMLEVGIAQFIKKEQPIPASWALAWLYHAERRQVPTAAERFPEAFDAVFQLRYRQTFGEGLVIKPGKSILKTTYRPSSQSFWHRDVVINVGLPDPNRFTDKFSKVATVFDRSRMEVDPLVRQAWQSADLKTKPAAVVLLPPELWETFGSKVLNQFRQRLEKHLEKSMVISGKTLLKDWGGNNPTKMTPTEFLGFLTFLKKSGYGIEPELKAASATIKVDMMIALYPVQSGKITSTYEAATIAIHLAISILTAQEVSVKLNATDFLTQINALLSLNAAEQVRLSAHGAWLVAQKPALRNLRSRIEPISSVLRASIAQFLVQTVASGSLSSERVKLLEKAYTQLGLDPQSLYSHIHDHTTNDQPVTVRKGSTPKGHKIPKKKTDGSIDMSVVQSKLKESEEISSLLSEIFTEETESQKTVAPNIATIAGLDAAHSEFLRALSQKSHWQREELAAIATQFDLMLDGALEVISEVAFDQCDEALIEGDNPIEVNVEVLEELLR
jgi:hypothetical protein